MRSFSIRTWLITGIIAMVIIPYAGMFGLVKVTSRTNTPDPRPTASLLAGDESLRAIFAYVESTPELWLDPTWQQGVNAELAPYRIGLTLLDDQGDVVFRHPASQQHDLMATYSSLLPPLRHVSMRDGDRAIGQALWYNLSPPRPTQDGQNWQGAIIVAGGLALMLLTAWVAVTVLSSAILQPLSKLAGAAQKISDGQLDYTVPPASLREVNDLGAAFDRMRDGLRESLERQAAMEEERRLFIAAIAHDLRTPLTSVRGYLEGLRDGKARSPERTHRYVSVALEKANQLESMIDGLFAFARADYMRELPMPEWIELDELMQSALGAYATKAETAGIALRVYQPPTSCHIVGDRTMLNRIIDNLLENALRYTPAGGEVAVGWRNEGPKTRFWVHDSGPGVPTADLHRVFQPLYRSDYARSSNQGGAGLGLAVAKRLVELHGGSIACENQNGARFTVTLPSGAADAVQ